MADMMTQEDRKPKAEAPGMVTDEAPAPAEKPQGEVQQPQTTEPAIQPNQQAEPYGAQTLRRLHEDCCHLMPDYDGMAGLNDGPLVRKILERDLKHKANLMDMIEAAWQGQYAHLPPLIPEEAASQPGGVPVMVQGQGAGDGADMDSDRQEMEPTGEEAFQASTKSLKARAKGGDDYQGEAGGRIDPIVDAPGGTNKDNVKAVVSGAAPPPPPGGNDPRRRPGQPAPNTNPYPAPQGSRGPTQGGKPGASPKALHRRPPSRYTSSRDEDEEDYYRKEFVGEAGAYLKELGTDDSSLDETGRMKCYHFHKALEAVLTKMGQAYDPAHDKYRRRVNAHAERLVSREAGKGMPGKVKETGGTYPAEPAPEGEYGSHAGDMSPELYDDLKQDLTPEQWKWVNSNSGGLEHPPGVGVDRYNTPEESARKEAHAREQRAKLRTGEMPRPSPATTGYRPDSPPTGQSPDVMGTERHGRRKALSEASTFFKQLAEEKNFGDSHRKMCGAYGHALLDALGGIGKQEDKAMAGYGRDKDRPDNLNTDLAEQLDGASAELASHPANDDNAFRYRDRPQPDNSVDPTTAYRRERYDEHRDELDRRRKRGGKAMMDDEGMMDDRGRNPDLRDDSRLTEEELMRLAEEGLLTPEQEMELAALLEQEGVGGQEYDPAMMNDEQLPPGEEEELPPHAPGEMGEKELQALNDAQAKEMANMRKTLEALHRTLVS